MGVEERRGEGGVAWMGGPVMGDFFRLAKKSPVTSQVWLLVQISSEDSEQHKSPLKPLDKERTPLEFCKIVKTGWKLFPEISLSPLPDRSLTTTQLVTLK